MTFRSVVLSLIILIATGCKSETINDNKFPVVKGQYLGQSLPGDSVHLFAPGLISTGLYERDFTMSPDGKEIYYSAAFGGNYLTLMGTRLVNGVWTQPEVLPFARDGKFFYMEPHVTPDGNKLLFLCTRPIEEQDTLPGWGNQGIWASDRNPDGGWGEPYALDVPGKKEYHQYYPSVTNDGTIYFTRKWIGKREVKIFKAKLIDGKYSEPEVLPEVVNGDWTIYNSFISPDESYLLACVQGHPECTSEGVVDYFIFFRDKNDNWSEAINLGGKVNLPGINATSQYVTPDGKFFVFSMSRLEMPDFGNKKFDYSNLMKLHNSPQNGTSDIYWISSELINELKNKMAAE